MILNSPYVSGSLTVTGAITACGGISISGSIASASYALNTSFLNGSGSGEFVPTGSFNTFSSSILTYTGSVDSRLGSIESTTASLNAASGSAITRLNALEVTSGSNITRISALEVASGSAQSQLTSLQAQTGSYATTGSNIFVGSQTITGSVLQSGSLSVNGCITSTGQIVAQTINVQQVTSSIVYSCGDNIFGTSIGNTQTFCGNVFNTGSLACFAGRICSNTLSTAGAVNLGGALTGTSATFSSAMKSNGVEITNTANSDILDIFQSPSVLNSFIDYPASRNLIIRNKGTLCGLTIESTGAATFNGGGVIIKSGNGDQLLLNNSGDRFTQINFSNNNVSKANIWWDNTNTELVLLASGSGTGHLKIANTGAATFSSSVNVGGASTTNDLNIYNTTNAGITLQSSFTGTTGNDGFYIGQSFQSTNFLFRNRENADIIFETNNGSERMRITSGGSINFSATDAATQYYFGANRPDATTLFVNGTNNNKIRIQNAESDIVVINSNGASYFNGGNVGIGISGPDVKLHVVGVPSSNNDAVYNLILQDPSAYNTRIGAGISFGGFFNTTDTTFTFANIKGFKENTTLNDYAGALAFTTRVNGGNPTERMRITSAGDMYLTGRSTNGDYAMYFFSNDTDSRIYSSNSSGVSKPIQFYTSGTERMRITSGGNVGIGCLACPPRVMLDIRPANNTGQVLLIGEGGNTRTGFGLDSGTAGMRIFTTYSNDQMIDIGGIGSDGSTWTRNHRFGIACGNSFFNECGGNVGIGTTTPCYKLDVRNASGTGAQTIVSVVNRTNDSNTGAFIGFGDAYTDTVSPYLFAARVGGTREGAGDGGFMSFYTRPTSGFEYERMRITAGGTVQIGCGINATFNNGNLCRYNFTALNTAQDLVGICANNGIIVIRDHTEGGTGAFLIDPNQGVICMASNIPATVSIAWSGSVWRWCLTSGSVPRCLGYGFYGA